MEWRGTRFSLTVSLVPAVRNAGYVVSVFDIPAQRLPSGLYGQKDWLSLRETRQVHD